METPDSSMRRVTMSQTAASYNKNIPISNLVEDPEHVLSKSRKEKNAEKDQQLESTKHSALLDITNNSPIVGLAAGSLMTPSSSVAKKRSNRGKAVTPGSGEALLRGQVKTLLQKVEEGAELSKISLETRPIFPHLQGCASSPMGLFLAPTPANTPQVLNLSDGEIVKNDLDSLTRSLNPDLELISQVVNEIFDGKKQEESLESQKSPITRSLLLDFSEKPEISNESECSSELTHAEGDKDKSVADKVKSSVWSVQVNANPLNENSLEEAEQEEETKEDEEYNGEQEYGGSVRGLCTEIEKVMITAVKFKGKHTRFVYNSDDEIVGGEEDEASESGQGHSL